MSDRLVLLLDGGLVTKKLQEQTGRFPTAAEVQGFTRVLLAKPPICEMALLRIYFYDADPYDGRSTNPIDGSIIDFRHTDRFRESSALLSGLELKPHFAVRRGSLILTGWRLGARASENLKAKATAKATLEARDIVPDVKQKGVDLKIGLDIAWISLKRLADCIVLVTADSDFVPAMKFARREGLRVYLDTLGHSHVNRDLRVHADLVL